jgi:beta-1,4-mannosyl-glycoprotein beta-1,4-N-acetylglucosaminyltransferase
MTLYDCCLFFNEYNLLELRLKELYDVVDFFVIVEGTHTFIGTPKESNFEKHRDRYEPYMKKIRYFYLPNFVDSTNVWSQEYKQRENIYHALKELGVGSTDTITICDCDEIPHPEVLVRLRGIDTLAHLIMAQFWYNVETYYAVPWGSAFVCRFDIIEASYKELYTTDDWHFAKKRWSGWAGHTVINGGWHFTYFGEADKIREKIANFSHQEINTLEINNIDNIMNCIDQKVLCFNKDIKLSHKPLEELRYHLPKNVYLII